MDKVQVQYILWSCLIKLLMLLVKEVVEDDTSLPVSYTHLDVYKRQFYNISVDKLGLLH